MRSGIIAGLTENGEIVIDCPVYYGNSGGLVINPGPGFAFAAIGVASRMVPYVEKTYSPRFEGPVAIRHENSGYAIVEPMDRVFEVIEEINRTRPIEPQTEASGKPFGLTAELSEKITTALFDLEEPLRDAADIVQAIRMLGSSEEVPKDQRGPLITLAGLALDKLQLVARERNRLSGLTPQSRFTPVSIQKRQGA